MLAVFEGGGEVLICEVDNEGKPKTADYFKKGTGRIAEEMDLSLVEGPIMITHGRMQVEPERILS